MREHLLTLLLLALIAPFSSAQEPSPVTSVNVMLENENMQIRISLGKDMKQFIPLPSEKISLTVETVAISGSETIQDLLRQRNRIEPDVEAFTLVYLLNPDLKSAGLPPAMTHIRLPKAHGGPQFEAALKKSYRVFLTTEPEIKDRFAMHVETFQGLMTEILTAEDIFENGEIRKFASASITRINKELEKILSGVLRRNGRPITKEPLEQLCSEIKLINEIFRNAKSGKKRIGGHEQEIFRLVEEDVSIKQRGDKEVRGAGDPPPPWPKVKVTVQAIPAVKKLEPIRFVYVPVALAMVEKPRPFPSLSSPSIVELTEAIYFFWGVKPGEENSPITEKLKFPVIKNSQGEIAIQLKLNP
ncbi:MAG: hypothetical protein ACREA2_15490 [Blastocatellia bacterium]